MFDGRVVDERSDVELDGEERRSIAWIDERIVLAVEARSVTARNLVDGGVARVALGATRDVVMIDTVLDASHEVAGAPVAIADGYAAQSDWDPRAAPHGYVYLVLRPGGVAHLSRSTRPSRASSAS